MATENQLNIKDYRITLFTFNSLLVNDKLLSEIFRLNNPSKGDQSLS